MWKDEAEQRYDRGVVRTSEVKVAWWPKLVWKILKK